MPSHESLRFVYANRAGRWLDFAWHNLALSDDGALRLASVPTLAGPVDEGIAALAAPSAPAGVTVASDGTVYFSVPDQHRILSLNPCDRRRGTLPCIGAGGAYPSALREPRGLAFHPRRGALVVADAGNRRLQLFHPAALQLLDVWGEGLLASPSAVAVDVDGNVYVVDPGTRRVHKFDLHGRAIAAFAAAIDTHDPYLQPTDIAVAGAPDAVRVYVLDQRRSTIFVFDADGQRVDGALLLDLAAPMGVAVTRDVVYVGDNVRRRVFAFRSDGTFLGEARGYEGPVAALCLDGEGAVWVHAGTDLPPTRLSPSGAYTKRGFFWGGPFPNPSRRLEQRHVIRAAVDGVGENAHLQLFVYAATSGAPPPTPVATTPFADPLWTRVAVPRDATAFVVPGVPGEALWIGGELTSEGAESPSVAQLRIDFDHDGYVPYLPAIYREDPPSRDFLVRLLALLEHTFTDVEAEIHAVSALFDPGGVPARHLGWLAAGIGLDLDARWPEAQQRTAVAATFATLAKRGTARGLVEALRFAAGLDARIEEPIQQTGWWILPGDPAPTEADATSVLGLTTMLMPAEALGAVVGTTAILDRSHLITSDEVGEPLFTDVAHRFTVQLHRGQLRCAASLDEARAIVEREKPAHTAYHLCVIEPRMRVGFQARLGIDSVIAAPPAPTRLGDGPGLVLSGDVAGRLGASRVGRSTRLSAGIAVS